MRVLISSCKPTSHFRPLLPFAHGLKARGHEVRIAALTELSGEIARHGFDYVIQDAPTDAVRADFAERASSVPRERAGKFFMAQVFMGYLPRAALPRLIDFCSDWRPDLVLRESTEFSGLIAAEKAAIRHIRVEIANGESEESIVTNYAREIDALRDLVSLPPDSAACLRTEASFTAHPQLLDNTVRVNSRAPFRFRVETPPETDKPASLDWAPKDGRPLIYITFGTIAADNSKAKHIYRVAVEALADLPVHALLTTGDEAPSDLLDELPPNVVVRRFVPQAEVLPHVRLLVCHGGSGTVLGGLAAGVPMVIAPLFADQPDNARCLASAGLALSVLDASASSLRAAISAALEDQNLRRRAQAAAREIAAMPTLDQALDVIAPNSA
jgi:MGT family glycosyltransferase